MITAAAAAAATAAAPAAAPAWWDHVKRMQTTVKQAIRRLGPNT